MKILSFPALEASVVGYLHEDHDRLVAHRVRPALIVCPGGGYGHLSPREADPPALQFFSMGYNVFILSYTLLEQAGQLHPLHQLADTVRTVREHAAQWHINPQKIAVMGFSAGGHLACSLGALWNHPDVSLGEGCRPNALLLCYPVITLGEFTHAGTRDYVTGGDPALRSLLSLEHQITPDFPPAFLWHTADDQSVPVENSLLLLSALRKNGIPFESHIFAHGVHGLSLCNREVESPNPECAQWLPLCKTWINGLFGFDV